MSPIHSLKKMMEMIGRIKEEEKIMSDLGFVGCTTRELEALCATAGVSDDISQEMFDEIQSNAEKIWQKAVDEFDKYLESKNLECCMGLIIQKETRKIRAV